jgi:hypothetical protein
VLFAQEAGEVDARRTGTETDIDQGGVRVKVFQRLFRLNG